VLPIDIQCQIVLPSVRKSCRWPICPLICDPPRLGGLLTKAFLSLSRSIHSRRVQYTSPYTTVQPVPQKLYLEYSTIRLHDLLLCIFLYIHTCKENIFICLFFFFWLILESYILGQQRQLPPTQDHRVQYIFRFPLCVCVSLLDASLIVFTFCCLSAYPDVYALCSPAAK
jgi:hypothetical protein